MLYPWRSTWVRLAAAAVGAVAAAVVVVTVIAAPASAHVTLNTGSAATGSTVDGAGAGFSPRGSAVELRLDRPTGSALWSGAPDRSGSIAFSFTVPAAKAGSHRVVATQTDRDGQPVDGTPATAPLEVTSAPPSDAVTQSPPPQDQQGDQQKQPGSQSQVPVPLVTTAPGVPGALAAPAVPVPAPAPAAAAPPAAAPPVVFSLPAHEVTHLTNPPPQVATLWRFDGAVPSATTASVAVTALAAPSPAASTRSHEAPSVLQLVALAVLITSAIVLIATALQLRGEAAPAPAAAATAPQPQPATRRSATMRSPDLWSGSPARLR
ncbi:MAG: hypothetical protein JOZ75_00345 [Candidatus Dormibacteraeota bacterium]|nr:hypothetical protein [Candidatus Dormibacteraeota bacterium]